MSKNPKDEAAHSLDKTRLDLLEPVADEQIARALAFGADKYGIRNFTQTPIEARVYVAALRRHIDAWLNGRDIDRDSGLHPLAHVGANVHVVLAAIEAGTFIDDRAASADRAALPVADQEPEPLPLSRAARLARLRLWRHPRRA
jgi:hypothetical protein